MKKDTPDYSAHSFLIVDDKPFLRNVIQTMLVRCRASEIKHAPDGMRAMDILAGDRGKIDCVLCDWNMKPIDGLALLRKVRSGGIHKNVPRDLKIVMLTGYGDESVVTTAIALGANGYVVKPVSFDKLTRAIDAAFTRTVALKLPGAYQDVHLVALPHERAYEEDVPAPTPIWGKPKSSGSDISDGNHDKDSRSLPLSAIQPGAILAADLYGEGGALLLQEGSVFSKGVLRKLLAVERTSGFRRDIAIKNISAIAKRVRGNVLSRTGRI